jgi:hypothetical protein
MKRLLFPLLLALALLLAGFAHPFYLSVTEIFHNPQDRSLEITLRVFTDDLELALRQLQEGPVLLSGERSTPGADALIIVYLGKKISFQADSTYLSWNYVGKEVEPDVTYIYLEINNIENLRSFKAENRLFFELYESQRNLLHLKANGSTKSILMDARNPEGEISYP